MKHFTIVAALLMSFQTFAGDSLDLPDEPVGVKDGKPVLGLCGGGDNGFYDRAMIHMASQIVKKTKGKILTEVYLTTGTPQNHEAFNNKVCHIMITQPERMMTNKSLPPNLSIANAHEEVVVTLLNKSLADKEGIDNLGDLSDNSTLHLAVVTDSGALDTLTRFSKEDDTYKAPLGAALHYEDTYAAVEVVAAGQGKMAGNVVPVIGVVLVSRKGELPGDVVESFGDTLIWGETKDHQFNNAQNALGEDMYRNCDVDSDFFQGIEGATMGDQDTICMDAQVVFNQDFVESIKGSKKRKLLRAIKTTFNMVAKQLRTMK